MSWIDGIRMRAHEVLRRSSAESRTDEEIGFHIDMETERNIAAGMTPAEARRQAVLAFGSVEGHREQMRDGRLGWLGALVADARFAIRHFARTPFTTLTMIGVLAFGIAISTMIFSVMNSVMTAPPLGIELADERVRIRGGSRDEDGTDPRTFSLEEVEGFREVGVFSDVTTWVTEPISLVTGSGAGESIPATGSFVSGPYLRVLGVNPLLGAGLPELDGTNADDAQSVMLSHDVWEQLFDGRPDVIGETMRINNVTFTVTGVAPPLFNGVSEPDDGDDLKVWLPFESRQLVFRDPAPARVRAVGLLNPGMTREAATMAVAAVTSQFPPLDTAGDANPPVYTTDVVPLLSINEEPDYLRPVQLGVLAFTILGSLVLLVACTNVSALLAGRAMARRREIAVRLSLGAARTRLIRQLLTESVLLALCSSAAALGLAWVMMRVFELFAEREMSVDLGIRWSAAFFALGVSLVVGILFGLSPALHATRIGVASALKDSTSSIASARGSLQRRLVITQIALTQPLIVAIGGLVVLGMGDTGDMQPTPLTERLVTLAVDLPASSAFAAAATDAQFQQRISELRLIQERLEQVPGVTAALIESSWTPSVDGYAVHPEDRVAGGSEELITVSVRRVEPEFFEVSGYPIVQGSTFADQPTSAGTSAPTDPSIVLDSRLAEQLWPGASAVGRRLIHQGDAGQLPRQLEVVGVYVDPAAGLNDGTDFLSYVPMSPTLLPSGLILLRTAEPAGPLLRGIRSAAVEAAPVGAVVYEPTTLANIQREQLRTFVFMAGTLTGAGILTLLISAVGLYAVVSFGVGQRIGEIAVRMAMGAPTRRIMARFLGDGLRLTAIGAAIGLPLALLGLRFWGSFEDAPPVAALPLVTVTVLGMAIVALAATWYPALRASQVQPATTLRRE